MSLKAVRANADAQREWARTRGRGTIESLYPELHRGQVKGEFSNTVGSHLLADLLGSPHVVVDLYDWPDEAGLIETYGVDLAFLCKLRDAGHVTLCANLEPHQYRRATWLRGILAESTTVFRSVRTPVLFERKMPDLKSRQRELRARLMRSFRRRSDDEISRLAILADPAFKATSRTDLARVLAIWATRLCAVHAGFGEPIVTGLPKEPEKHIVPLHRAQLFAVSPHSAGLGAPLRMLYERLGTYFPERPAVSTVGEDFVRLEALNAYLTRLVFRTAPSKVTSADYWHGLDDYERDALFERLSDREERRAAMQAEETLRLEIAKSNPTEWDEAKIKRYGEQVADHVASFENRLDVGVVLGAGYLVHAHFEHLSLETRVLLLALAHGILGHQMRAGRLARMIELAVPKIQLAHFVMRHRR